MVEAMPKLNVLDLSYKNNRETEEFYTHDCVENNLRRKYVRRPLQKTVIFFIPRQ